jgi:hypothetical protein
MVCEYATFTVPLGTVVCTIASEELITIDTDNGTPTTLLLSVAVMEKLVVPPTVGVPEIRPALESVNPVGNEPVAMNV